MRPPQRTPGPGLASRCQAQSCLLRNLERVSGVRGSAMHSPQAAALTDHVPSRRLSCGLSAAVQVHAMPTMCMHR